MGPSDQATCQRLVASVVMIQHRPFACTGRAGQGTATITEASLTPPFERMARATRDDAGITGDRIINNRPRWTTWC